MLHLHNNYSFTESLVETVIRSLRHSCRSELHVLPQFPVAQTIPSPGPTELSISIQDNNQGRRVMKRALHPGISPPESLRGSWDSRSYPRYYPWRSCKRREGF